MNRKLTDQQLENLTQAQLTELLENKKATEADAQKYVELWNEPGRHFSRLVVTKDLRIRAILE